MQNINHTFEVASLQGISSKKGKGKNKKKFFGYALRIKAECNATFLQLLAYDSPPNYDKFFFDSDGLLLASHVSALTLDRTLKHHKLLIELDELTEKEMRFLDIEINGFNVAPTLSYVYAINFSILLQTTDDELAFLNRAVKQDNISLSIEEPPQIGMDF